MRTVGVTGFMARDEVLAALDALPEGLTLMVGVLASAKSLRGERNKWWRRYPRAEDIADIFVDDPRCLNLVHFAPGEMGANAGVVERISALGGPRCDGIQFNGVWPTLMGAAVPRTVILQYKPGLSDPEATAALVRAFGVKKTHVLIDASGGRGEGLNLSMAERQIVALRAQEPQMQIGIAGGLCAETLHAASVLIQPYGLSIDAEGRLRDGDEGGVLNLDKVRAYLKAASEIGAWS